MSQPYPQGWSDPRYPAAGQPGYPAGQPGHGYGYGYPTGPQWAAGPGPVFSVRLMRHTGMLVLFTNTRFTVTGDYQRCAAAIREVQIHNLVAGWWSLLSLLLNPIALLMNREARQRLDREAGLRQR